MKLGFKELRGWKKIATVIGVASVTIALLIATIPGIITSPEEGNASEQDLDAFLSSFLDSFLERMPKGSRVAVLPLTSVDGKSTYLGRFVTDEVIDELLVRSDQREYMLVDREYLASIEDLLKWAWQGLAQAATSPKLGELLVPTYFVTGTVFATDREVILALRMVDLETGRVISLRNGAMPGSTRILAIAAKDSMEGRNPCLEAAVGFIKMNHEWLWTAILVPMVAWLWSRRSSRTSPSQRPLAESTTSSASATEESTDEASSG